MENPHVIHYAEAAASALDGIPFDLESPSHAYVIWEWQDTTSPFGSHDKQGPYFYERRFSRNGEWPPPSDWVAVKAAPRVRRLEQSKARISPNPEQASQVASLHDDIVIGNYDVLVFAETGEELIHQLVFGARSSPHGPGLQAFVNPIECPKTDVES
jgi:hypothetical protein